MQNNNMNIAGAIIAAGVLISGAILLSHKTAQPVTAPTQAPTQVPAQGAANNTAPTTTVDIKSISTASEPFIGQANAPVTIAYWSDYQCPFCKQFEENIMTQIISNYVQAGKVKIVFKDFPFLGENPNTPGRDDSTTGALYGRAVWQLYPSQYFAWRTAMFKAQDQEGNQGFGDETSVKALTATIAGIDAKKVSALVSGNKMQLQALISADKAEFQKNCKDQCATPGFIIGTKLTLGAKSYADFSSQIDALLKP